MRLKVTILLWAAVLGPLHSHARSLCDAAEGKHVAIVDAISTMAGFPEHLFKRGLGTVRVWSGPRDALPEWFDEPGADDLFFDGDLKKLAGALKNRGITGVVSGSDQGNPLAQELAAALGLPGNDPNIARLLRDKYEQILLLKKAGVPVGDAIKTADVDEAIAFQKRLNQWPVFVKPTNTSGGQGAGHYYNKRDLRKAFKTWIGKVNSDGNINDALIVMADLSATPGSIEYVLNFTSQNGVHILESAARYTKVHVKNPGGGYSPVYESKDLLEPASVPADLKSYGLNVLHAFGLKEGASHLEIFRNPTIDGPGRNLLVELNPRIAGGKSADLIEMAAGENSLAILAEALSRDPSFRTREGRIGPKLLPARKIWLRYDVDGTVTEHKFLEELAKLPSLKKYFLTPVNGRVIKTYDLDGHPGWFFLVHKDWAQIEKDTQVIMDLQREGFFRLSR